MPLGRKAIALSLAASAICLAGGLPAWNGSDQALAAPARQKASKTDARQELNQIISSLRAVDTAYASGNSTRVRLDLTMPAQGGIDSRL